MIDESESHEPAQAQASEFDAFSQGPDQSTARQLLVVLEAEYPALLVRLSAHLRSPETAAEALHDVYLKLRSEPSIGDVRSPRSYLYTMAVNAARNGKRNNWRVVDVADAAFHDIPDNTPNQEAITIATDEMSRALQALHALPERRRAMFLAKWRDDKTQAEIAAQFGLHKRSVQKELARVEMHLRKVLRRL